MIQEAVISHLYTRHDVQTNHPIFENNGGIWIKNPNAQRGVYRFPIVIWLEPESVLVVNTIFNWDKAGVIPYCDPHLYDKLDQLIKSELWRCGP